VFISVVYHWRFCRQAIVSSAWKVQHLCKYWDIRAAECLVLVFSTSAKSETVVDFYWRVGGIVPCFFRIVYE
jgi:hypothetical protein